MNPRPSDWRFKDRPSTLSLYQGLDALDGVVIGEPNRLKCLNLKDFD